MTKKTLPVKGTRSFEELKEQNEHGAEYWSARELQPALGYKQWRRFEDAVKRAVTSCNQSGNNPDYHFAGAGKPIKGGKGAVQVVEDYHLSRFACYLIAQNGDPRKAEIAEAQKYFAIQARRQEMSDVLAADVERVEIRKQTSEEFKAAKIYGKGSVLHQIFALLESNLLEKIWGDDKGQEKRPDLLRDTTDMIECRSKKKLLWMMKRLKANHFTDFWV
ncbi:MAG: hypothetical protein U9R69_00965 [Thermodesulfobacteriota bacterium]|nr:hypothetical protein [Thermodesulfobacteriota bacterium]